MTITAKPNTMAVHAKLLVFSDALLEEVGLALQAAGMV